MVISPATAAECDAQHHGALRSQEIFVQYPSGVMRITFNAVCRPELTIWPR